jgi:prolyl oligopeptidase
VIQGVTIADDYRWLEDAQSPGVRAWSDGQNAYARSVLDRLPAVGAIRKRVGQLLGAEAPDWPTLTARPGMLFALKRQPPKQQPFIVVMRDSENAASERVVVDPNALDSGGGTAIDWFVPSPDGKKLVVSLSKGGSEAGDAYVYDVATGKAVPGEVVPRVHGGTAGGSAAWKGDGSGFYYTRYPRAGERSAEDLSFFQQVYFHRLGTPTAEDTYVLGKQFPRIAEVELHTSDDGTRILVNVSNGDGGEHAIWLLQDGRADKVAPFAARVTAAEFGGDGSLLLLSRYNAGKGRILVLPPGETDLDTARVLVPEQEGAITGFLPTDGMVYVVELLGGPSRLRAWPLDGGAPTEVPTEAVSAVDAMVKLGGNRILYRAASYVTPDTWFQFDPGAPPTPSRLAWKPGISFDGVEVTREFATSKDGTKVPVNILAPKGAPRDGSNAMLLGGYGGYGVSRTPTFNPVWKLWLEQGGVVAVANIRGGGEYGDDWHLQGNLTRKQNVFDDFYAVAKHLVDTGWTKPEKLGIRGGSNGGLLMGAMVAQHPEAFGAVVSTVGIYDMLHVENDFNGAFNVTEFGTVKDKSQFEALFAYSPYHRIADGTKYPPVLCMTGANDPRVWPYHSRKFVARLQAAGGDVLLRTSATSGHGVGNSLSQDIADATDQYSFLLAKLGITFRGR